MSIVHCVKRVIQGNTVVLPVQLIEVIQEVNYALVLVVVVPCVADEHVVLAVLGPWALLNGTARTTGGGSSIAFGEVL